MYKGAVFFDYDGTLTDENNHIYSPTQKTIYTLEKLRANGYATFLATGRMKPLTKLVSGKFTGLIASNGSYTEIEGKCIRNICIPPHLRDKAVEYMNENGIFYALETQVCAYANGLNDSHFLDVLDHFKLARSLFKPLIPGSEIDTNKIIITYDSEEKVVAMAETFRNDFAIKAHRYCLSADVNDITISKAVGVEAVLSYLNIPKENAYALGDGENDATMLEAVGHGIAMGDHSSSLDLPAEYITKSVKNDGIFHALCEHYNLV